MPSTVSKPLKYAIMKIFVLMTGKGQYNKTTENLAVRYYLNADAANKHLDYLRKLYARKGNEHYSRVTTKGRGYFTMKYGWPIKGAELRHTYWIESHEAYTDC